VVSFFVAFWQNPICIPLLTHACYMPCSYYPSWLHHSNYTWLRVQVMKLKNGVFWDVTPCGSCKNRHFWGTLRLHHQGDKNQWTRNNARWEEIPSSTAQCVHNILLQYVSRIQELGNSILYLWDDFMATGNIHTGVVFNFCHNILQELLCPWRFMEHRSADTVATGHAV
jgi:hypothetical protein